MQRAVFIMVKQTDITHPEICDGFCEISCAISCAILKKKVSQKSLLNSGIGIAAYTKNTVDSSFQTNLRYFIEAEREGFENYLVFCKIMVDSQIL